MKISRGEITITDVPGVEYIKVNTGKNTIEVKFDLFDYAMSYESAKLVELRDALTVAIDAMTDENSAAGAKPTESTSPTAKVGDIFTEDGQEPWNVLTFKDCEGDIWRKGNEGAYFVSGESHTPWRWGRLVNTYGPITVTEVSE